MKGLALMCAAAIATPASALAAGPWTLTTADTRITVSVAGVGVAITCLSGAKVPHNWAGPTTRMPLIDRVWIGGREIATAWRFDGGAMDRAGHTLTLRFTNAEPRIELRSIWRARPGRGPIEHWIEIENRSGARVTIPQQESLALPSFDPGGSATLRWIRRGGGNASTEGGSYADPLTSATDLTLDSNCDDGKSPVPWLAVQVGKRYGLYVGWEFSGLGRIHAKSEGGRLDLAVGNMPDFRTDVEPGEMFLVPPAFVGCYAGDVDDGSYSLHRFIIEKLRPAPPKGAPDPILAYNLYLDAGGNQAKEVDVLRSARFCHALGFEAFMPDAMWFPATGDWRWDPARFPHGIGPIERYVHTVGMKMALWCAWTNGGDSSDPQALSIRGPVAHPDWFSYDVGPDWKPGPFYGAQVCLACAEAREWEIRKTQSLVRRLHLDYLKHDCGPIVNQCNKTTHRHHYGVDASYWATMGYYEVQEKLRAAFPNLLLENCSGGGHIKDFGVIRRTHYTVTTDTLSNLPDRQSIYDSTFALPPLLLQAYTYDNYYPVRGDAPGPFLWRSAMMGAWQIDPTDTLKWTDGERDAAIRAVRTYKRWIRPMLRDVKVHHILPRPDGVHWDGMFYWCARLKRGTLYVFRPEAKEASRTIRLKGLDAGKRYWVWSEDGSVAPGERKGADLMNAGLTARLPQQYTSDIVYVRDGALGKPSGLEPPGPFALGTAQTGSDAFTVSARLTWSAAAHARTYRVAVSRGGTVIAERVVTGRSAVVANLPEEAALTWRVQATSSGGRRWNAGSEGRFATGKRKPLAGVTFVSDMPWVRATAGAGNTPHRDTNYYALPLSVGGVPYPKGVWTHAFNDATPADLVLDIQGRGFGTFAADAGLDDASGGGSVQFQALVDGVLKAESPVMRPGPAHAFRVDVSGARQVTLRVLNGGDGYVCDHAAWGLARFVKADATDPLAGR